mmetsp:Transcript_2110/g.3955  ORF Transcript_2110/g.3955 Transcript_2110/m.3955 type:complete len:83 (+) Transcript_2110:392-640(+)
MSSLRTVTEFGKDGVRVESHVTSTDSHVTSTGSHVTNLCFRGRNLLRGMCNGQKLQSASTYEMILMCLSCLIGRPCSNVTVT